MDEFDIAEGNIEEVEKPGEVGRKGGTVDEAEVGEQLEGPHQAPERVERHTCCEACNQRSPCCCSQSRLDCRARTISGVGALNDIFFNYMSSR